MTLRQILIAEIESLPDSSLPEVIDFVSFLKTRHGQRRPIDEEQLSQWEKLYAECHEEDQLLAESGLPEYIQLLENEDRE